VGIKVPAGFCVTLFADSLRAPRELAVAPNGDVFVAQRHEVVLGRGGKRLLERRADVDGPSAGGH